MRRRHLVLALTIILSLLGAVPGHTADYPPQAARGLTVPTGFAARPFANLPPGLLATSLTWGASTVSADAAAARSSMLHGTKLYVTAVVGNFFSGTDNGYLLSYEDEGTTPTIAAQGLDQPLGAVMGPDQTLYVSENEAGRGRVTALTDTNDDGTFETKRTVLKSLPNGRHQTNGLTFGRDGFLYVANGNATDDGIECGPQIVPGSGEACTGGEVEILPWSGSILRVDPTWTNVDLLTDIRLDSDGLRAADGKDDESVLVARGFRNIYDVDFDPQRPDEIWTPMNGPDNPSGSEPIYGLSVTDERYLGADASGNDITGPNIENAGFPSCLYDPHTNDFPVPQIAGGHEHAGEPEPQDSTNELVINRFGPCPKGSVIRPKAILEEGHEGTSGAAFTRGTHFPARYRGDLFIAEWGSMWNLNGGEVTGHKVVQLELNADREVVGQREFMSGILPMDLTFGPNGHMYVADMTGQIYDVMHLGEGVDATTESTTVEMRQQQFVSPAITVIKGQTVKWLNNDTVAHTVRAQRAVKPLVDPQGAEPALQTGKEMDSPTNVAAGASYSHTFTSTGTYHYICSLHPSTMQGTVTVLPVER
jgi:glucose/arabinose dehydrogenase